MKLVICTKFQVNRMNCVESRRGGGPIDPPSRLRITIFSRRLLGLKTKLFTNIITTYHVILKSLTISNIASVLLSNKIAYTFEENSFQSNVRKF